MLALTTQTASELATQIPRGAHGPWEPGAHPWLYALDLYGPRVMLVLVLLLVLRALGRHGRYRAGHMFNATAQRTVHDALVAAEERTIGEIVPVVVERSDRHPSAEWLSALVVLLLGTGLLATRLPWETPWLVLAWQAALASVGWALARLLPDWKRLFVSEARASEMAEEQAALEFHRLKLHATSGETGVLLFVSLFERRVVVLGDLGIHARVGEEHWRKTKDEILSGVVRGHLDDGLVRGIQACGEVLARHFPWAHGDRNEIPDRVVVRTD